MPITESTSSFRLVLDNCPLHRRLIFLIVLKVNIWSMDIVLLQLPFWGIGCPPLGLSLLKSYLAKNGLSCKVIDINAQAYCLRGDKYQDYWDISHGYNFCEDEEQMLNYYRNNRAFFLYQMGEIKKLNPKVIGCSCQSSSFIITKLFLEDLRNIFPDFKHILGGPQVAGFMNNARELLATGYIDAVNYYEGEVSLVEYVRSLNGADEKPISGLVYKKNGKIIEGGPTHSILNLNELPFPDFSDFNLKNYSQPNVLPSYTSRGCINQCIYCTSRNFTKPFRFRSATRVFEEIKYLKQQYSELEFVRMCDNISNSNIKELELFCDLMIQEKSGIKWDLENAVIRREMNSRLYKKLKKAGCTLIGYGMETPSAHLLAKVGKVLSRDVDIGRVLREGKRAGIYIGVNVMFGLPGETEDDLATLLDFLRKNRRSFSMINPALAFCEFCPGSDVYSDPSKYGIDMAKGSLFWESKDRSNTYPERMKRFELFCQLAKKYKIGNLFNIQELPNKHKLLFQYYFTSRDRDNARLEYPLIRQTELTAGLREMFDAVQRGDFTIRRAQTKPLSGMLFYGNTFEDTFIQSSLSAIIENLERANVFKGLAQTPWKRKIRSLLHKAVGYDVIEKKIEAAYPILKMIEAKISFKKNNTTIT